MAVKVKRKKRKFKVKRQPKATDGIGVNYGKFAIKGDDRKYLANIHYGPGKPKAFETPEAMAHAAEDYFKWCNDNPWIQREWKNRGKGYGLVEVPLGRPFTWSGLCSHVGVSSRYFASFRSQFKAGRHEDEEFVTVIDNIDEIIKTQKFEGASVGTFNGNLIAYDLGLKKDVPAMYGNSVSLTINVIDNEHKTLVEQVKAELEAIDIEHELLSSKQLTNGKANGKH